MSCPRMQKWLDDTLIVLPSEPLPIELAEHARVCPRCRKDLEIATRTLASIQPSHRVEVSEQLKGRIMNKIMEMDARVRTLEPERRARVKLLKPLTAAAVALLTVVGATVLYWSGPGEPFGPPVSSFTLLQSAWAAEQGLFTQGGIVHIVNEIVVKAVADPALAQARWFPIMAVEASGTPRIHQLALGAKPEEEYVVDDQAWYDSATGRFVRLLSAEETPLFANAYDGTSVYSLEPGPDGRLAVVAKAATENFQAPSEPAAFLGIAAGLPSNLDELDETLVQDAGVTELADGSEARVVKSTLGTGEGAPAGASRSEFLFKIREDDNTIAEMEWTIDGQSVMVVRRAWTETINDTEVDWDLAKIESMIDASTQPPAPEEGGLLGMLPDIVKTDVSVAHMVERADFETYIFRAAPSWAEERQITDILDVASIPHRMFAITYRADDGRHVVLIQSPSYNSLGQSRTESGPKNPDVGVVYTSPNGIKVWGGPQGKWLAEILLSSSRAILKDAPSEDRTGYLLETPSGTFPALAVNGQITDEELHALVDSLVPAKEHADE
ncbi:MAG: hypothetical protein IT365_05055 [Candidatus Hydrogenedentes bacterium]|nr:hypothetical protein [Candidatus Hydrogenedentota bacterium]